MAVASEAMGVNRQEAAHEVAAGPAHEAEPSLEVLGLGDRVGLEEVVDGLVAGDERKAVDEFEALLGEAPGLADPGHAEGGLVDQLEGQAAFDAAGGLPGPLAEEVPGPQAEVLGDQEPEAQEIARHLVGQELADAPSEGRRVGRDRANLLLGAEGLNRGRRAVGPVLIEFFFEGRSRRRSGPRYAWRCARRTGAASGR